MSSDRREVTVERPAKDWLEDHEAAAFLGLTRAEFLRRVKDGDMPPGSFVNESGKGGTYQWYWQWVVGASYLRPWLDRRQRARRKRDKVGGKPAKKPGAD